MFGISTAGWLVPAIAGLAIGYLASPMLGRFLPIKPFQAYAGSTISHVPMRHPAAAATIHRPITHAPQVVHPTAPITHYVPVRRSFDRSYDSWLHTTVNSLPAIG